MAEEDIYHLFDSTWLGIVEACLSPLPPPQVRQGLQLLRVIPPDERTSFQQRFRNAVNGQFHKYATGKEWSLNVTGVTLSLQLTYEDDLNTIIDAASRRIFRGLFVRYLQRASDLYRITGEVVRQREAEELVVSIMNLR